MFLHLFGPLQDAFILEQKRRGEQQLKSPLLDLLKEAVARARVAAQGRYEHGRVHDDAQGSHAAPALKSRVT